MTTWASPWAMGTAALIGFWCLWVTAGGDSALGAPGGQTLGPVPAQHPAHSRCTIRVIFEALCVHLYFQNIFSSSPHQTAALLPLVPTVPPLFPSALHNPLPPTTSTLGFFSPSSLEGVLPAPVTGLPTLAPWSGAHPQQRLGCGAHWLVCCGLRAWGWWCSACVHILVAGWRMC